MTLEEIIESQNFPERSFNKLKLLAGRHPALTGLATATTYYGLVLLSRFPFIYSYAPDYFSLVSALYFGYVGAKLSLKQLYSRYVKKDKSLFARLTSHTWLTSAALAAPFFAMDLSKVIGYYTEFSAEGIDYSLQQNLVGAVGKYASLAFALGLLTKYMSVALNPSMVRDIKETIQIFNARAAYRQKSSPDQLRLAAAEMKSRLEAGNHSAFTYNMLGLLRFELGEFDEGFLAYTNFFSNLKNAESEIHSTDFYSMPMLRLFNRLLLQPIKRHKERKSLWNLGLQLEASMANYQYSKDADSVVASLETCIEAYPQKLELQTLKSLFLTAIADERADPEWVKSIEGFFESPELVRESFGETANTVYTLGPSKFFTSTLALKEHKSLASLQEEYRLQQHISGLFEGYESYRTAEVLLEPRQFPTSEGLRNVYLTRYAPGFTFMALLEAYGGTQSMSTAKELAKMTAIMHANSPEELSGKGRLHLALKVKSKLLSPEFKAIFGSDARKLARNIISNYRPVFNSFKDSIYGLNFDSHPEQFIVAGKPGGNAGPFTRLDTEDKGVTPLQFDLVNLLEYGPFFSESQKQEIIHEYITEYNQHTAEIITDEHIFMLQYHNAVIQRAISLCSAWSSTARHSMWKRRKEVLDAALSSIEVLKQEYEDYYSAYESNYEGLSESLSELNINLSAYT